QRAGHGRTFRIRRPLHPTRRLTRPVRRVQSCLRASNSKWGRDDMQGLLKLSRAIDWLNAQVGKYVIWLILASTAISAINAVVRKVFNTSSNAFLEVQWYLFAWSFLVAAGFTLLHREHVRIDVVNSRLPKK